MAENKKQFLVPKGFFHNFLVFNIQWPQLMGEYKGTSCAAGYRLKDGTPLNISEKDQKWQGITDTFKF
jgi:dTDP-4-dehydrorhamnose 3,5-epimerase